MSKPKHPSTYQIPLHKCQICYQNTGRFILDCYCIFCDSCYTPNQSSLCQHCHKPTRNKRLDTRDPSTFQKVGYMFNKPEIPLLRGIEIVQFQANVANKYMEYVDGRLRSYERAVYELVRSNPRLDKYFSERIKGFRVPPKTPNVVGKNDTPDPKKQENKIRYNSEPNQRSYYNNAYTRKHQPEIKISPRTFQTECRDEHSYHKPTRPEHRPPYPNHNHNPQTRQPKYQRDDHRKPNYPKNKKYPSSYQSQAESSYRTNIHSSQLKPYIEKFRRN